MSVPSDQDWLFWDVDSRAIDLARDRRYVLGRVLERGRLTDVRWAVSAYGLESVHEFFRTGAHPEVSQRTRAPTSGDVARPSGDRGQVVPFGIPQRGRPVGWIA